MIVSASRRTDIPACYSKWFLNRLREGFVYVRNPVNFHMVRRVGLDRDVVDGIVFWTKNPLPMMDVLDDVEGYCRDYYFQFTVTPYGKDVEPGIPSKADVIIPAFQALSDRIGRERVVWRYDPILLSEKYTPEYHARAFEAIAGRLHGYTNKCTISFIDFYQGAAGGFKALGISPLDEPMMRVMAKTLSEIAHSYGLEMDACAEAIDLGEYGIGGARCVDGRIFERMTGHGLDVKKDGNQRPECGCDASVDIGMYNTCGNGCRYCYANHSEKSVLANVGRHDAGSPLLCGEIGKDDVVKERVMRSCKILV